MVKLYKLSSEQLSQQKHYDFGMRAVKSVLEMAGRLKRNEPDAKEENLLIRAMKDANIPKFLKEDLPLFNALIQDLFPDIDLPDTDNTELIEAVNEILANKGLQVVDEQNKKIVQMFETINVRFGSMVVGEAMIGKSVLLNVLKEAMTLLRVEKNSPDTRMQSVYNITINPKSITMGELYGEENPITKDWFDGLASHYIREATNCEDKVNYRWVTFDGPVDPLWIENMNSVLDDSRL